MNSPEYFWVNLFEVGVEMSGDETQHQCWGEEQLPASR